MPDQSRRESVRIALNTANDQVQELITDKTTVAESSYLMATLQASALTALALAVADLTDVVAEIRDAMREKTNG